MNAQRRVVVNPTLTLLLRIAALVVFILAIFVAGNHLDWGTWQQWVSVGFALWVASDLPI